MWMILWQHYSDKLHGVWQEPLDLVWHEKAPENYRMKLSQCPTFRCKTRSPSAGKSGHVSEQFKFSALQKNFFSTLTLNLKHPHFLPAASRGGKTYHHPTELHFYWTSSHSFNAGKENTQWNVSLFADSLNKTYGRWWVRTCDLSATVSSTISPPLNPSWPPAARLEVSRPWISSLSRAWLVFQRWRRHSSSSSAQGWYSLSPSHIIINTLWWGHCYTHTEKHTHSRTDKQLRDYRECTSGSLRRRQTAQMLQRQDTQRATVISMPVLCAAVLICSPCLEKEFCLVSLALGSALCRESSPPSLSLSLLHILCFSAFQLDFFSRLYRKIHDVNGRERKTVRLGRHFALKVFFYCV